MSKKDLRQRFRDRAELMLQYLARNKALDHDAPSLDGAKPAGALVLGHCKAHAHELAGRAGGVDAAPWYKLELLRGRQTPLVIPPTTVAEILQDALREMALMDEDLDGLRQPQRVAALKVRDFRHLRCKTCRKQLVTGKSSTPVIQRAGSDGIEVFCGRACATADLERGVA